eukprot:gene2759-2937_t
MNIPLEDDYSLYPEKERWIRHFIDFEIFDPVWFQVLRNHPELQVDSDGKQIQLPRNHNLRNILDARQHTMIDDYLSGMIALDERILTTITANGYFCAYHSKNMRLLRDVSIRSNILPPPVNILPGCEMKAGSYLLIKEQLLPDTNQILMNYSNQLAIALSQDQLSEMIVWKSRIVVLGLDVFLESMESATAAATGGKKPAAKKDAPPIEIKQKKFYKYRMIVYDVFTSLPQATSTNNTNNNINETPYVRFDRIHDFYLENINIDNNNNQDYLTSDEIQDLLTHAISTDLSTDGRILNLIIHENQYTTCLSQLYDLTKPKDYILMNLNQLLSSLPRVEEENDDHSVNSTNLSKAQLFSPRSTGGGLDGLGKSAGPGNSVWMDNVTDPVAVKNPFLISQTRFNGPSSNSTDKRLILKKAIIILPVEVKYEFFYTPKTNNTNSSANPTTSTNPVNASAPPPTNTTQTAAVTDITNTTNFIMIEESRLQYYPKIQVLLIPNDIPCLLFYGMSGMRPDWSLASFYNNTANQTNAKDKAKDAKKGKDKEDPNANNVIINYPFTMIEVNRWYFTSTLSAWFIITGTVQLDRTSHIRQTYREYLILGQNDGVITMWDICKQNLIGQLGTHPSPITTLTAYRNDSSSTSSLPATRGEAPIIVLAGAMDGTVTIYCNKPVKSSDDESKAVVAAQAAPPTSTKNIRFGPGSVTSERSRIKDNNGSVKSLNTVSSVVSTPFADVRKGIAISDFRLLDFRHDGFNDSIIRIDIIYDPYHTNILKDEEDQRQNNSEEGKELHIVLVQYLSGMIGVYVLLGYDKFLLIHSLNREERIQYEPISSTFMTSLHLPLQSYQFPEPPPPVDPANPAPTTTTNTMTATEENLGEGGLDEPEKDPSLLPDILSSNQFTPERLHSLYEQYNTWTKNTGKSLSCSSLSYIQSIVNQSNIFYLHISRQNRSYISKYIIRFTNDTIKVETNYNVDYLDINAVAEMRNNPNLMMTTSGKVSKLKEKMPSTSASKTGLLPPTTVAELNAGKTSPTTVSYKTLRLTEERLAEHEKAFQKTSQHHSGSATASITRLQSGKNSQNMLQMELNNSLLPVDLIKAELWQNKKTRMTNKGKLSKKLTALANLCG